MNATAAAAIRLVDIRKHYPGRAGAGRAASGAAGSTGTVAVDRLTMRIPAGEVVVLIGPSGCGKSTILRMVNRLVEPSSGHIFLGDEEITHVDPVRLRRKMGYVIQHVGLFPHHTVYDNVATVPRLLGWPRRRIADRVDELLSLVGLPAHRYARRYPRELSGGQRQRVGVARALAADPVVLLMDEPFSAVDPIVRGRLQGEFLRLQAEVRKTVLFVTHDVDEAIRLGDRVAVLSEGGRLEQYDPPAVLLAKPANDFVAEFVGADRGIMLLGVTPIPESLRPMPADPRYEGTVSGVDRSDEVPAVAATASLREALAALLEGGRGWVAVRGDDGGVRGVLTVADIHAAATSAISRTAPDAG